MTAIKNVAYVATLAVIWAGSLIAVGFVGKIAWWLVTLGWGAL